MHPLHLQTRTVLGAKVTVCSKNCADSFRQDKQMGLIYPQGFDNGQYYSWIDWCKKWGKCVYCFY